MKFVPVTGTDVLFCIHETRWKDYAEYAKHNREIDKSWQNQTHDGFRLAGREEDHAGGAGWFVVVQRSRGPTVVVSLPLRSWKRFPWHRFPRRISAVRRALTAAFLR